MSSRTAQTSAPVLDAIAERWSPRSFDSDHSLPEGAPGMSSVTMAAPLSSSER